MRSTIDIDDKLIEKAKKLTGVKTKKEVIHISMKELIRKKKLEHLLSLYGKSPIDISVSDVEKFRKDAI